MYGWVFVFDFKYKIKQIKYGNYFYVEAIERAYVIFSV